METLKRKDPENPDHLYNEDTVNITIYATVLCQSWWQELAVEAEKRGKNTSIFSMVVKEVEAAYPINVQMALVAEQNKSLSTVRRDLIRKVFNLSNWNYPRTTPRKRVYISASSKPHKKQTTHKEYNQMIASLVGKELFDEFEMDAARSRTTPKELLAAVVGKFVEQQRKKRAAQRAAEAAAGLNPVEE